jgi:glycosyltransferase involved in cell wall biosynthesis
VLDLARELQRRHQQVAFYSYVPPHRATRFGLDRANQRPLLQFFTPFVLISRQGPQRFRRFVGNWLQKTLDVKAAGALEPCDVFIGMSGLAVHSAQRARSRYGATVFLERGSRHILSQKRILDEMPGRRGTTISPFDMERELWGYDFADVISVPSRHVERSFLDEGVPSWKLFRNPYGVDLEMFPPTLKPQLRQRTAAFVGAWSLQKGCDILWQACQTSNSWKLLHVGHVEDAALPTSPLFEHREPVPQWQLKNVYAEVDIFVHASRQEGLSLVQAQALACGVPLVCTDRTGGEDFRDILMDPTLITVVPSNDANALAAGIERGFAIARHQTGLRDLLGTRRPLLSWKAYASRYLDEIARRLTERGPL